MAVLVSDQSTKGNNEGSRADSQTAVPFSAQHTEESSPRPHSSPSSTKEFPVNSSLARPPLARCPAVGSCLGLHSFYVGSLYRTFFPAQPPPPHCRSLLLLEFSSFPPPAKPRRHCSLPDPPPALHPTPRLRHPQLLWTDSGLSRASPVMAVNCWINPFRAEEAAEPPGAAILPPLPPNNTRHLPAAVRRRRAAAPQFPFPRLQFQFQTLFGLGERQRKELLVLTGAL